MQRPNPKDETQDMLARMKAAAIGPRKPGRVAATEVVVSRNDLVTLLDLAFHMARQASEATIAAADARSLSINLARSHEDLPTAAWLFRDAEGLPRSVLMASFDTTSADVMDVLLSCGEGATTHELIER